MTPGVRTEPELHVRIVERERRLFVVEDEHYEGSVIGTRQLKADGSWTMWSTPCDVVEDSSPVQILPPVPVSNYTQVFAAPSITAPSTTWTYPTTTTAGTTKLATTSYVESTSMMTVNPAMLATITPTS